MPLDTDDMNKALSDALEIIKQNQKNALAALREAPPLAAEPAPAAAAPSGPPPRPKRCQNEGCKAKIHLTDFACRCDHYFCSAHRHAESHNCQFDFKKSQLATLETQLVKVSAAKLATI